MDNNNTKPIYADVKKIMSLFSLGRNSAAKLGTDAGAKTKVGSRVLYHVPTIEKYLLDRKGA